MTSFLKHKRYDAAPDPAPVDLDLASWRKLQPSSLAGHLDDYISMLVRLTEPVIGQSEDLQYLLANAVCHGGRGRSTAFVLAEKLDDHDDEVAPDLICSWMAVAALATQAYEDSASAARILIALKLLKRADEAANKHAARKLQLLAYSWTRHGDLARGLYCPQYFRGVLERMSNAGNVVLEKMAEAKAATKAAKAAAPVSGMTKAEADEFGKVAKVTGAVDSPAMIVCQSIGVTGKTSRQGELSGDDKAIAASWKCLTEPMSLAIGPAPDTLSHILGAEFPWMAEVIAAICGDLTLRRQAGLAWAKWRPTLLVGPPGSGKTRFARRLSELLKIGFGEVNAAGSSDNRSLQGTARGWGTTMPCYPLCVMRRAATANPLILVDELDKPKPDGRNGDIRATLLTMLEPLNARSWPDECLVAPVDLSAVNWLACANDAEPLRGPLLTRLRLINVPVPSDAHFDAVLGGMRRDLSVELGVAIGDLPELPRQAEDALRNGFRRGISLRRVRAAVEGALLAGGGFDNVVRH